MEQKRIYQLAGGGAGLLVSLILLIIFTVGGKTVVTGRVLMHGRPVIWGSVVLIDSRGQAAAGRIEPDGTFEIVNAPTGEITVTVSSPDPLVGHYKEIVKSARTVVPSSEFAALPVDRQQWFVVPKRYEDPRTSDLKITVKPGKNPPQDLVLVP